MYRFTTFASRLLCVNIATPPPILSDLFEVCNVKFSIVFDSSLLSVSHDSVGIIIFGDFSSIVSFSSSILSSVRD